jgi:hypothetical protein
MVPHASSSFDSLRGMRFVKQPVGPACPACGARAHRAALTKSKLVGNTEVVHLVFEWACGRCGRHVEGAPGDPRELDGGFAYGSARASTAEFPTRRDA